MKNTVNFDPGEIPAFMRRSAAGKEAKKSGEAAEKAFDDAAELWERQWGAAFERGHFETKVGRDGRAYLAGKGSVDRLGTVNAGSVALSVLVEIKEKKGGRWRPPAPGTSERAKKTRATFVNEFECLKRHAKTGAFSFILACECDAHGFNPKWYAFRVMPDADKIPARREEDGWIPFELWKFPELVRRIFREEAKRSWSTGACSLCGRSGGRMFGDYCQYCAEDLFGREPLNEVDGED